MLLCLLTLSLGATASMHAQESRATEITCDGAAQAEGNTDPVPADGDQPVTHHHGTCHGHSLTVPVTSLALLPMMTARETPNPSVTSRLARRMVDPALEPPRA
jgi:hypothetical protein